MGFVSILLFGELIDVIFSRVLLPRLAEAVIYARAVLKLDVNFSNNF